MRETTFGALTVEYDEHALAPRPWTQLQSSWGAELLTGAPGLPQGDVLELFAGVGHIGLLAVRGSDRRLVQVEDAEEACRLAWRNAERAGMADRVEVRRQELRDGLRPGERFALVIADPPWVPSARIHEHPDDPPAAIDGGRDGLEVVRACLPVVDRHLDAGGALLLQVGSSGQVEAVRRHLVGTGLPLRVVEHRLPDGDDAGAVALLTR